MLLDTIENGKLVINLTPATTKLYVWTERTNRRVVMDV